MTNEGPILASHLNILDCHYNRMKHITKMLLLNYNCACWGTGGTSTTSSRWTCTSAAKAPTFSRRRPFARCIAPINWADCSTISRSGQTKQRTRQWQKAPEADGQVVLGIIHTWWNKLSYNLFLAHHHCPFTYSLWPPCLLNRINVQYCNNVSIYRYYW
jgi:hypothetical protein